MQYGDQNFLLPNENTDTSTLVVRIQTSATDSNSFVFLLLDAIDIPVLRIPGTNFAAMFNHINYLYISLHNHFEYFFHSFLNHFISPPMLLQLITVIFIYINGFVPTKEPYP